MNNTESEQKLEQVLNQAFKGLPPRRAPGSLESRVVNELARRALLPWWRVSFANWPVGARVAFVFICAALVAATILGGVSAYLGGRSFNEASALVLGWGQPLFAVMFSAGGVGPLPGRAVPPSWL